MAIRQRVEKLEAALGNANRLHFLSVYVADDETKDAALERTLNDAGIEIGDVSCIWYVGAHLFEVEDRGGCAKDEDLIGYREFWEELRERTATSWQSSMRKILQKRREMAEDGRLEESYREMPLMRPPSE
jgi:hypothetical protein